MTSGYIVGPAAMGAIFSFLFITSSILMVKNMFEHKVITTKRAALVTTKQFLFFSPGVTSVNFQDAMTSTNIQKNIKKIATLEYGGRDGSGNATISGMGKNLSFSGIKNIALLEGKIH